MATITGLTAARMLLIEAKAIISGAISGDNLILTARDGTTVNAGNVRGAAGLTPVLRGVSVTSQAIGTGSKTFAISPAMNIAFPVGATVKAQGAAAGDYMVGLVTAATTTSVTINVTEVSGTGTFASWTVLLGSFRGTDGVLTGTASGDLAGSYPSPTIGLLKVVTGYLADLAVTTGKLADLSVTTGKLANNAVTAAKMAAGIAVPVGGTTGQALVKTSNVDGATAWGTIDIPPARLQRAGSVSTGTHTINVVKTTAVVFSTPFPTGTIPIVTLQINNSAGPDAYDYEANTVTEAGFNLVTARNTGTASLTVGYVAVPPE